ncbi:MAG: peroxiredoxin Q/BCP [Planctomycetota bacterium]|jgi:peroxiredoxin Q/BCP
MCALRDAAQQFATQGVTVFGISTDDVKSQAKFKKAQSLAFRLLSDPDGSVAKKYGVLMKGRPYAKRVTFILDDKGVVRTIIPQVEISAHGEQVLQIIAKLRG